VKPESAMKPTIPRFLGLLVSATVMTALFTILGTPMLRVLRNVFGSTKYWISGFFITALLMTVAPSAMIFALLLASLWITVGVYQELEERGHGNFWTAILSVAVGSSVIILGPLIWAQAMGLDLSGTIRESIDQLLKQLSAGKGLSEYGISSEGIVKQIPSMAIGIHITSLAFALMLDRKVAFLFGLRFERIASQMRLLEFRLPDSLIWVAMISFLLSFIKTPEPWMSVVALNVFNVMMGLYMFQGLAVLEMSFLAFRVGSLARLLIYVFVVGQLFFLLSAVGLIDYWVDFRQRLKRWKMSERNHNNEENI
jgi:hypothetical protein